MIGLRGFVGKRVKSIFPGLSRAYGGKPEQWRCFRVEEGKISPPLSCELNAVDHCNLTCLDCNHASPAAAKAFADPDMVHRDFSTLAMVYRARFVKILGGEPLLHPDLFSVIQAVRESGISKKVLLVTNGTLLHQLPDAVWGAVDQLEVSSYPGVDLSKDVKKSIQSKASQHQVKLVSHFYPTFRITFSRVGTNDDQLVRRIYRACKLANLWGCQSIYQGFFFKCPQSIYISNLLDERHTHTNTDNGIKIGDSPAFFDELTKYLRSDRPLKACRYCLGSVGLRRAHRFVIKSDWKENHSKPTEELVDFEKLKKVESGFEVLES